MEAARRPRLVLAPPEAIRIAQSYHRYALGNGPDVKHSSSDVDPVGAQDVRSVVSWSKNFCAEWRRAKSTIAMAPDMNDSSPVMPYAAPATTPSATTPSATAPATQTATPTLNPTPTAVPTPTPTATESGCARRACSACPA